VLRLEPRGFDSRRRELLAGWDESDPRYSMYAAFLRELYRALRHAARGKGAAAAEAVGRWSARGLCQSLLRRLAAALVDSAPKVSHGQEL